MNRIMTCIICPGGCELTLSGDEAKPRVTGNRCPRGAAYAQSELTNPVRVLTTTLALAGGGRLPVRTDRPIPRAALLPVMAFLADKLAPADAKRGDRLFALPSDLAEASVIASGSAADYRT